MKKIFLSFIIVCLALAGMAQVRLGDFKIVNLRELLHSNGVDLIYEHPDSADQFKYVNMADPLEDLDGVNLRTLRRAIASSLDTIIIGLDTFLVMPADTFYNEFTKEWLHSGQHIVFPERDTFYNYFSGEWLSIGDGIEMPDSLYQEFNENWLTFKDTIVHDDSIVYFREDPTCPGCFNYRMYGVPTWSERFCSETNLPNLRIANRSREALKIQEGYRWIDGTESTTRWFLGHFDPADSILGSWQPNKILHKSADSLKYKWIGTFIMNDTSIVIGDGAAATKAEQIALGDSSILELWTAGNVSAKGYQIGGDSIYLNHLRNFAAVDSGKFAMNNGDSVVWTGINIPELRVDTIYSSSSDTVFMNILKVDSVFVTYSEIDTIYSVLSRIDTIYSTSIYVDTIFVANEPINLKSDSIFFENIGDIGGEWRFNGDSVNLTIYEIDGVNYEMQPEIGDVLTFDGSEWSAIPIPDQRDSIYFENENRWLANGDSFLCPSNEIVFTYGNMVGRKDYDSIVFGGTVPYDFNYTDSIIFTSIPAGFENHGKYLVSGINGDITIDMEIFGIIQPYVNCPGYLMVYPLTMATFYKNDEIIVQYRDTLGLVANEIDTSITITISENDILFVRTEFIGWLEVCETAGCDCFDDKFEDDDAYFSFTANVTGNVTDSLVLPNQYFFLDSYDDNRPFKWITTGDTIMQGSYFIDKATNTRIETGDTLQTGSMATKNFWTGTQAEYDAISPKDDNTIYFIEQGINPFMIILLLLLFFGRSGRAQSDWAAVYSGSTEMNRIYVGEKLVWEKQGEETDSTVYLCGKWYKKVKIGTQTWLAENLYCDDGEGGIYSYNDEADSSAIYGYLYTWDAAMRVDTIIDGWHLPTDSEWETLTTYLGGTSVAGGKLKETGTNHWNSPNTGATNESGFTALPGGNRNYGGAFYNIGFNGFWWSATENSADYAWNRSMYYNRSNVVRGSINKKYGFSVRLIKD